MIDSQTPRPLIPELRATLWLFAGLALIAGVLLFVLSERTDDYFSWPVAPPLTAAFLGSSYWAAFVLIAWSARQPAWVRAQAALPPVLVIAVLLLVATLIHLDRFDMDSVFGPFWLVVYILVTPALVLLLRRQLRAPGNDDVARAPLPTALRALVALQGVVMLGMGTVLFLAPEAAADIWPWPLTPLNSRVVGAFVFGFGVAAANAVRDNDLYRFEGAALAYTTLGVLELVALVRYTGDLTGGSLDSWLYSGFLGTVVLAGGVSYLLARQRTVPAGTDPALSRGS